MLAQYVYRTASSIQRKHLMKYSPCLAALSLLALSACGSGTMRDTLGLDRASPDEFRVVSRPPLSVPPQFSLEPPSATGEAPNQLTTSKQAKGMMYGTETDENGVLKPGNAETAVTPVTINSKSASKPSKDSTAESQFLKNAGADNADPKVREKLVEEKYTQQEQQQESSWWDIMSTNPPKKDTMVNAKKEAERIKTDEDTGKPVTDGETPTVKDRDTGVLGRLLGY